MRFHQMFLLYGAGISAYTDSDDIQIGLQPTIGITGKPLGSFWEGVQLYYTLIIPFIGEEIDVVPAHNFGIRVNFPIGSKTKQVRRINVGEGL